MHNISVSFHKKMVEYTEETRMFSSKKVTYPTLIVDLAFSDTYREAIQRMNLGERTALMTYELIDYEFAAAKELERLYPDDPARKAIPTREFHLMGFIINNPTTIKAHYFHTLDTYIHQIQTSLANLDVIIRANLPGFNGIELEEKFQL